MVRKDLNLAQKIFKYILPKKIFDKIEDESQKWFIHCDHCGYTISYWDAGGIRVFAKKKKKIFGYCPSCKKYKFLDLKKLNT